MKEKILDKIFVYKLIKKTEYADLEKEVALTIKERENIKDTKNKIIKAQQERIESLETTIKTKDNIFKKKDHDIYELTTQIKTNEGELKHKDKEIKNVKKENKALQQEIETLTLQIENLNEELKQKTRLLSRFKPTKEEIKAYENNHREVLKKIRE